MRYKVLHGGRGGGKSYAAARAILLQGIAERHRVLCTREIQKSIKDSVHKLLEDQITEMGLEGKYQVLQNEIRGKNGTEIIFSGLAEQTVTSIKSMEGCTIVWCEEAQNISKRSWDILIPTIRADDSEIWVTFNPDLETDETYQRFVVNPPENCRTVEIHYKDNPWHNEVMEKERLHCLKTDPDNYPNIWEGKCRPAVEGAIYFKQIQELEAQGRIQNVPYDSMLRVHPVFDLGWADSLGCGLVQKGVADVRVIEYIEASHTDLNVFSAELKTRPYNWGKVWLPHDGFSGHLNSGGKSTCDILTALGWDVASREEIVELSIEEGIRNARLVFPRLYFDKTKCNAQQAKAFTTVGFGHTDQNWRLIECLKRYRRHINRGTQAATGPVKDDFAHGADVIRYICANVERMTNEDERTIYIPNMSYQPLDAMIGL